MQASKDGEGQWRVQAIWETQNQRWIEATAENAPVQEERFDGDNELVGGGYGGGSAKPKAWNSSHGSKFKYPTYQRKVSPNQPIWNPRSTMPNTQRPLPRNPSANRRPVVPPTIQGQLSTDFQVVEFVKVRYIGSDATTDVRIVHPGFVTRSDAQKYADWLNTFPDTFARVDP